MTRFGKFSHLVEPGLNWKPTFIDDVTPVNVEAVRELAASGVMLTSDENVVRVEMNVQYRVTDPQKYLFSVTSPDDSLRQATDSALRGVIGKYTMDRILTEGRTVIRSDTQRELEETIKPYNMGITLLDVNFQAARPPEEVKAAFDDAIAARENEQQYIREAEAYTNEVQPRANGQAQRILEEARAYKTQTILEAQGEVARFAKILPEYKAAPQITRERLYIETMEKVLSHTRKVLVNDKSGNLMVLPLDQMLKGGSAPAAKSDNSASNLLRLPPSTKSNASGASNTSSSNQGDIITNAARMRSVTTTSVRGITMRKSVIAIIIIVLVVLYMSVFVVKEGERGITLRFGKVLRDDENKPLVYAPGLHFKIPFIESVKMLDARIQTMDNQADRFVTKEKKDLIVDSYIKWRISDFSRYYLATGGGDISQAEVLLKRKFSPFAF